MTAKKMNRTLKICLLVLGLLIIGGLYFANQKLSDIARNTSILKAKLEVSQTQVKSYEASKAKVEELAYIKDVAQKIIPADEDQSVVVAELASFAKRSNITIASLVFTDDSQPKTSASGNSKTKIKLPSGVSVVPVTLTASGTVAYSDLLDFLGYIEKNQRKIQVTQISITPDPANGNQLSDVSFSLNLFVKSAKGTN